VGIYCHEEYECIHLEGAVTPPYKPFNKPVELKFEEYVK
jgi:hypothetical protein